MAEQPVQIELVSEPVLPDFTCFGHDSGVMACKRRACVEYMQRYQQCNPNAGNRPNIPVNRHVSGPYQVHMCVIPRGRSVSAQVQLNVGPALMPDFMSGAMFHAILAWPTSDETRTFHRASNAMIAEVVRLTRRASPEKIDECVRDWPQHDWTSILAASAKRRIAKAGIEKRLEQRMVAAKIGISLIHEALFRKPQQLPPSISRLSIDQLAAFVAGEVHINDPENVEKLIWRTSLPIIHLAIATQLLLVARHSDEKRIGYDLQDYEFYRDVILLARLIEPIVVTHKKINISADRLTQVHWYG